MESFASAPVTVPSAMASLSLDLQMMNWDSCPASPSTPPAASPAGCLMGACTAAAGAGGSIRARSSSAGGSACCSAAASGALAPQKKTNKKRVRTVPPCKGCGSQLKHAQYFVHLKDIQLRGTCRGKAAAVADEPGALPAASNTSSGTSSGSRSRQSECGTAATRPATKQDRPPVHKSATFTTAKRPTAPPAAFAQPALLPPLPLSLQVPLPLLPAALPLKDALVFVSAAATSTATVAPAAMAVPGVLPPAQLPQLQRPFAWQPPQPQPLVWQQQQQPQALLAPQPRPVCVASAAAAAADDDEDKALDSFLAAVFANELAGPFDDTACPASAKAAAGDGGGGSFAPLLPHAASPAALPDVAAANGLPLAWLPAEGDVEEEVFQSGGFAMEVEVLELAAELAAAVPCSPGSTSGCCSSGSSNNSGGAACPDGAWAYGYCC